MKRLSGDGSFADGVIGSEKFNLIIDKKFKLDAPYYFCTSHPNDMLSSFSIIDKKKNKGKPHIDVEAVGGNDVIAPTVTSAKLDEYTLSV